jgi:hypothetical protein
LEDEMKLVKDKTDIVKLIELIDIEKKMYEDLLQAMEQTMK